MITDNSAHLYPFSGTQSELHIRLIRSKKDRKKSLFHCMIVH